MLDDCKRFRSAGTFGLCGADGLVAALIFSADPNACNLAFAAGAGVCEICGAAPGSEDCVRAGQEYCKDYPHDTACAQFLPVFRRAPGEVAIPLLDPPKSVYAAEVKCGTVSPRLATHWASLQLKAGETVCTKTPFGSKTA